MLIFFYKYLNYLPKVYNCVYLFSTAAILEEMIREWQQTAETGIAQKMKGVIQKYLSNIEISPMASL